MASAIGIDVAGLLAATPQGAATGLANRSPAEVASEFEAMLLTQMIAAMRKTVGESGLLAASPQRKVFDGVFDNEMARSLVASGGLGLAETLTAQIEQQASRSAGTDGGRSTPVEGRISSGYGMRSDPFTGKPHHHSGIDISAPEGSEIRSVRDGVVVFSGTKGVAGQVVEIRNRDGTVATYAHAKSLLAEVGDGVRAGDVVATVGSTGRATGPHLHFSVRREGRLVDPTPWLNPTARNHEQSAWKEPT